MISMAEHQRTSADLLHMVTPPVQVADQHFCAIVSVNHMPGSSVRAHAVQHHANQ